MKVKKSRGKMAFSCTRPVAHPLADARLFGVNRTMKMTRRRVLGLLAGAAALVGVPSVWITRMKTYDGPVSDHFDGTHFFDPDGSPPKGLVDMLRWWTGPAKTQWPAWAPSPCADRPPARVAGSAWRISYVGHADLVI